MVESGCKVRGRVGANRGLVCRVLWRVAKSEVLSSVMVISAESVSFLDSVELIQLGSDATISHVGLFRMIQLCLELFM